MFFSCGSRNEGSPHKYIRYDICPLPSSLQLKLKDESLLAEIHMLQETFGFGNPSFWLPFSWRIFSMGLWVLFLPSEIKPWMLHHVRPGDREQKNLHHKQKPIHLFPLTVLLGIKCYWLFLLIDSKMYDNKEWKLEIQKSSVWFWSSYTEVYIRI